MVIWARGGAGQTRDGQSSGGAGGMSRKYPCGENWCGDTWMLTSPTICGSAVLASNEAAVPLVLDTHSRRVHTGQRHA